MPNQFPDERNMYPSKNGVISSGRNPKRLEVMRKENQTERNGDQGNIQKMEEIEEIRNQIPQYN